MPTFVSVIKRCVYRVNCFHYPFPLLGSAGQSRRYPTSRRLVI
jgi:hypothetical protein